MTGKFFFRSVSLRTVPSRIIHPNTQFSPLKFCLGQFPKKNSIRAIPSQTASSTPPLSRISSSVKNYLPSSCKKQTHTQISEYQSLFDISHKRSSHKTIVDVPACTFIFLQKHRINKVIAMLSTQRH